MLADRVNAILISAVLHMLKSQVHANITTAPKVNYSTASHIAAVHLACGEDISYKIT